MDEFETRKRELLQPLLLEAGAGLMDCQSFEFGIALLLFHFGRLGVAGLDPSKIELILSNTDKKTAGQLISLLKKHLTMSDGFDQKLSDALAARNELIHRVLIDNAESLVREEGREELLKRVRQLRKTVRAADQLLRPFILAFGEALDGIRHADLEAEVRALFGGQPTG